MLEYGKLPNGKYMINWPVKGNDYYINVIEMTYEQRLEALKPAKLETLKWVYFLQTNADYKNLGLADDEFPTEDKLAFIPYYRESRRMYGLTRFKIDDIQFPYQNLARPLYKTAIAVGDYPVDHHHKKNAGKIDEGDYPRIPSFSVPYECLVPKDMDGLLVAEKSISVTHITNGSTRLQPVVMLLGQTAGAAAALCVQKHKQPRELQVRELQKHLLDVKCWLMPFLDINPENWAFESIQRIGVSGVMKGRGVPFQWSNQTWFYPENCITKDNFIEAIAIAKGEKAISNDTTLIFDVKKGISRLDAVYLIWEKAGKPDPKGLKPYFEDVKLTDKAFKSIQFAKEAGWTTNWVESTTFEPQKPLVRKEAAFMIDIAFDPFNKLQVNLVKE
jgi:hypothetical protein